MRATRRAANDEIRNPCLFDGYIKTVKGIAPVAPRFWLVHNLTMPLEDSYYQWFDRDPFRTKWVAGPLPRIITDPWEIEQIARRSMQRCFQHGILHGDRVIWHKPKIMGKNNYNWYWVIGNPKGAVRIQSPDGDESHYVNTDDLQLYRDPYEMPPEPSTEKDRLRDFFFGKPGSRRSRGLSDLPGWRKR